MTNAEIKSIAILGAGWLGMPLGKQLVELGYQVHGSTTRAEKLEQIQAKGMIPFRIQIKEDIQGEDWENFFQADLLVLNIPPRRRVPNIEQLYPKQMRAILQAVLSSPIRFCIFVSSTSVYGNHNHMVTEETPLAPTTGSGRALVESENLFQNQEGLETTILRMAGLAGADRKLGRFLAGKTDLPNGDARVNLVHLDDCIGVIRTIIKNNCWNEVFNVSADEHPVKRELYTKQALALGLEPPTFAQGPTKAFKIVSNEKLKKVLDYTFAKPDPKQF